MKTPDEIKKGLESCGADECHGDHVGCPYQPSALCIMEVCCDALAYIQQLENHIGDLTEKVAQIEAAQPRWISVEERLPEENGKYIVCTAKGSVYCTKFSIDVRGSFHTDMYTHVTHWMPLPEPPKEA